MKMVYFFIIFSLGHFLWIYDKFWTKNINFYIFCHVRNALFYNNFLSKWMWKKILRAM